MHKDNDTSTVIPHRQSINNKNIGKVLALVRREVKKYHLPIVTFVANTSGDPFRILIATMLSLRTKDLVTAQAAERLFKEASTPQAIVMLPEERIAKVIYPVGFYKTKAKAIKRTCERLIKDYHGRVPDDIDTLVTLPGVGRKTANLVLTLGYHKPAMCVDTHVNRISNIWGYVKTKNPFETEMALREKLPKRYWHEYNDLLVSLGQHVCIPASPKCSICPLNTMCPKIGVKRSR